MTSSGAGVQTMRGYRPWNLMWCLAGVAFLVAIAPARATAQAPEIRPTHASPVDPAPAWGESFLAPLPSIPRILPHGPQSPSQSGPSATRVIVTHAAVGTGAGLLIGLALSGADVSDDRTSVVVTWTALGLTAGLVAGVIAWLVE